MAPIYSIKREKTEPEIFLPPPTPQQTLSSLICLRLFLGTRCDTFLPAFYNSKTFLTINVAGVMITLLVIECFTVRGFVKKGSRRNRTTSVMDWFSLEAFGERDRTACDDDDGIVWR